MSDLNLPKDIFTPFVTYIEGKMIFKYTKDKSATGCEGMNHSKHNILILPKCFNKLKAQ